MSVLARRAAVATLFLFTTGCCCVRQQPVPQSILVTAMPQYVQPQCMTYDPSVSYTVCKPVAEEARVYDPNDGQFYDGVPYMVPQYAAPMSNRTSVPTTSGGMGYAAATQTPAGRVVLASEISLIDGVDEDRLRRKIDAALRKVGYVPSTYTVTPKAVEVRTNLKSINGKQYQQRVIADIIDGNNGPEGDSIDIRVYSVPADGTAAPKEIAEGVWESLWPAIKE